MPTKRPSIAILGMSPGNSYFKENIIKGLIANVKNRFAGFRIMIPDHPAEYTYKARGDLKYQTKARLKGNAIRNKVLSVIDKENDIIFDWKKEINTHPAYKCSIRKMLRLYRDNELFKDALESSTKEVLQSRDMEKNITQENLNIGVKFLICELAFLVAAKEILGSEVTYIYHRPWPIFTDLIAGKFDGEIRPIDFEILSPVA